jgi:hydroxyacylglutathione hydrolase
MLIRQIVDDKLAQNAYLIGCQRTGEALVVDPERDVDRYLEAAAAEGLHVVAVAETHIHADFLSGARELAARLPGLRVYLSGEGGDDWRYTWPDEDGVAATLLRDGDTFTVGRITIRAWHTPGHTPEHIAFVVTDEGSGATVPMGIATGDFVFVGDLGRPDLLESAVGVRGAMASAAQTLHRSVQTLAPVDDFVQVWPGHGAGSACGKALGAVPVSTFGYERRTSPALRKADEGLEAFVSFILRDQPEPPLYFARMKQLNRQGPPLLGRLPEPPRLDADALARRASDVQVVDTRDDRHAFLRAHCPGSFHAPLTRAFPTIVGSMVEADRPMVLIVDEARLDEAVRALVRIGYDHIAGWAPRDVLDALPASGVALRSLPSIDIGEFERRRQAGQALVLDVRGAAEYAVRHVPGAVNIAHTRLLAHLADGSFHPDGQVLVHCASGVRAAAAAALLARHGIDVVHVDGEFASWQPADAADAAAGR